MSVEVKANHGWRVPISMVPWAMWYYDYRDYCNRCSMWEYASDRDVYVVDIMDSSRPG